MAEQKALEPKVSYKDTLNLPHTDFPIRANSKIDDPAMINRWEQEDLFTTSFYHNKGQTKFILHDGPPYANGHLHLGHAYNKILKDIVTKSQRMFGKHVPVTPGWDCHGLPIEFKVSQDNPGVSPQELKVACRNYATKWIDIQRQEFKALGVLMNWKHPYLTMSYGYEASILRAFGSFVAQGYIERKNKTVPWCPSCQTVLATAEIEYEDRKDPSTYVLFPLEQRITDQLLPAVAGTHLNLLVWTTTPWTLPLNRAVLLKPGATYAVLAVNTTFILVGKELADSVANMLGVEKKIVAEILSDRLYEEKAQAEHPFIAGLQVPVLLDNSVSLEDGTACVHCAPGCGPEDYEVGIKNKLEIFSPISPDGKYTAGIQPAELEGVKVSDGQIWVLKKLTELGRLLHKTSLKHSYPHCWRCHGGLIYRATKQWFCDLSRDGLKTRVLQATTAIATLPEKSINRLQATLEGRLEWCLSRQRIWGVPIPSLLCTTCDYTYITPELIEKVAQKVSEQGIEYWDKATPQELLPANFSCPSCKGSSFKKEQDILDVWFDSGVSHFAVLYSNEELAFPADMYLEGKDQHRGWFQSSLLTGMVLEKQSPMKMIVTHGFTVDEKGRKMSKSLGNVITPDQMIEKLGVDGLRLWVSSIDCSSDAVISQLLMQNVQEVFRKVRNTCRFLLSNLYDYDHEKDAVAYDKLRVIDQYALERLYQVHDLILEQYARYDFTAVFHTLADYCTVDLSAFYLDIVKDRLYVEKANGIERRAAQTVCWIILDTLTRAVAPILSITAEQISDHYQKNKKASIHLQSFASLRDILEFVSNKMGLALYGDAAQSKDVAVYTQNVALVRNYLIEHELKWDVIKEVRSALLKAIEGLREQGIIKHSLEARLTLHFDLSVPLLKPLENLFTQITQSGQSLENFFKEFVIVSQVTFAQEAGALNPSEMKGVYCTVEKADGDKCPRCWQWNVTTHEQKLCERCQRIVGE